MRVGLVGTGGGGGYYQDDAVAVQRKGKKVLKGMFSRHVAHAHRHVGACVVGPTRQCPAALRCGGVCLLGLGGRSKPASAGSRPGTGGRLSNFQLVAVQQGSMRLNQHDLQA